MNNLTPITEKKVSIIEKFKLTWYFEKPHEKIILILIAVFSAYAIWRIMIQGFW